MFVPALVVLIFGAKYNERLLEHVQSVEKQIYALKRTGWQPAPKGPDSPTSPTAAPKPASESSAPPAVPEHKSDAPAASAFVMPSATDSSVRVAIDTSDAKAPALAADGESERARHVAMLEDISRHLAGVSNQTDLISVFGVLPLTWSLVFQVLLAIASLLFGSLATIISGSL